MPLEAGEAAKLGKCFPLLAQGLEFHPPHPQSKPDLVAFACLHPAGVVEMGRESELTGQPPCRTGKPGKSETLSQKIRWRWGERDASVIRHVLKKNEVERG